MTENQYFETAHVVIISRKCQTISKNSAPSQQPVFQHKFVLMIGITGVGPISSCWGLRLYSNLLNLHYPSLRWLADRKALCKLIGVIFIEKNHLFLETLAGVVDVLSSRQTRMKSLFAWATGFVWTKACSSFFPSQRVLYLSTSQLCLDAVAFDVGKPPFCPECIRAIWDRQTACYFKLWVDLRHTTVSGLYVWSPEANYITFHFHSGEK